MTRQQIMRHLYLGCGESLSQRLPELRQEQVAKPQQKPVVQVLRKTKRRGGRA